jgi:hypothetical protein
MVLQPWAELCREIVDLGDRILSYAPYFAMNRCVGLHSLGTSISGDLLRKLCRVENR